MLQYVVNEWDENFVVCDTCLDIMNEDTIDDRDVFYPVLRDFMDTACEYCGEVA